MKRYVVVFRDSSALLVDHDRIANTPGVRILDETTNKAMLIEASSDAIAAVRRVGTDRVSISEETTYARPGLVRPSIRR